MTRITINVTQQDIDEGVPVDGKLCAVGRALTRAGVEFGAVTAGYIHPEIIPENKLVRFGTVAVRRFTGDQLCNPEHVKQFINAFDACEIKPDGSGGGKEKLSPISFDIDPEPLTRYKDAPQVFGNIARIPPLD